MRQGEEEFAVSTGAAGIARIDADHVVSAYARWAPVYDWSFGIFTRHARIVAVQAMNALPPSRILELGVGTGISLPHYDAKHRVSGIDLSPDMLERARRRVVRHGLRNVEDIAEMDAGALTYADGTFDAAVAMFVITVVPDPDRVITEMVRVVRPGGAVTLISHFSAENGARALAERHLSRFSATLGWRPNLPVETVLGRPELHLVERRAVRTLDTFTLLSFKRL